MAPRCIGVHLHGEELTQPEIEYISKGELFTATLGTCFVAATSRLTEAHTPSSWEHEQ